MKKIIAFAIAATAAFSAHAGCIIYTSRSQEVSQLLNTHGGWDFDNYDRICGKLDRANAGVQIVSDYVVLGNQSIGWASVMIKDRNTSVMTNSFNSMSTFTNSYASQDKAKELMYLAINDAMKNWTALDQAVDALNKERREILKAR